MTVSVTGGHGGVHRIGEQLNLCYGSLANQFIVLSSTQGSIRNVIRQGVDDGRGECVGVTVSAPTGIDNLRVDVYNAARTAIVDYAQVSIIVVP